MPNKQYSSPLDHINITSGFGERNLNEGSEIHLG